MSRLTAIFAVISAGGLMLVATGCNKSGASVSAETLDLHKTRLVLQEEPEDDLQTVVDVRNALLGIEEPVHDHAAHDHEEADHEEADHDEEGHAGHDHHADEHAADDHEGHDHDGEAHPSEDDHAGHDHDDHAGHDHDDHAGHSHEPHATGPMEVLVVGQIGGLTNPWESTQPDYPFGKNEAMFFLADPGAVAELEASGHVHAPGEECAFCAAHAAETSEMLAMVRFLGDRGKVLPIEIQQLVDVKSQDTVVVKGTARIIEGGMMVIDAVGIYVRN